jgi:hypothetical protein
VKWALVLWWIASYPVADHAERYLFPDESTCRRAQSQAVKSLAARPEQYSGAGGLIAFCQPEMPEPKKTSPPLRRDVPK